MINVTDLSVKFESGYAVENVSLTVDKGDYFCIVGENGSGKTTLMKAILGLIKPTKGNISLDGIKQSEIGFIPQQTIVQKDFPTNVMEAVLSGFQGKKGLLPFYTRDEKNTARQNLKRLGAESLIYKSYRDLSGGQQQRVLLARALCAADKILLLDEPVTGLDPMMANELYSLLSELNNQGITIIMISHDIQSAVKYGNKILHMQTKPLFYGSTSDYVSSAVGKRMMGGLSDD